MADANQVQEKVEPQTNCPVCNKHLSKKKKYYKNGKYYCGKRCWKKISKDEETKRKEKAKQKEETKKQKKSDEQPAVKEPQEPKQEAVAEEQRDETKSDS